MSYIAFRTRNDREALVSGSERFYMGSVIGKLFYAFVPKDVKSIKRYFPEGLLDPYIRAYEDAEKFGDSIEKRIAEFDLLYHLKLFLNPVTDKYLNTTKGKTKEWILELNTALLLGSDAVKLLALLHGQCEIHAWISASNRKWAASIIATGLEQGLYRAGSGWGDVVGLLTSSKRGAVVTSYSVTESFNWRKDRLRADREISPERLKLTSFGNGANVFDLLRARHGD